MFFALYRKARKGVWVIMYFFLVSYINLTSEFLQIMRVHLSYRRDMTFSSNFLVFYNRVELPIPCESTLNTIFTKGVHGVLSFV